MIAEFALTPALFDPASHPDRAEWRDRLMDLKSGMFPRSAQSAVLVSDLAGGSWQSVIEHMIRGIKDPSIGQRLRDLFTCIQTKNRLVRRPKKTTPNLNESLWWAREAIASADGDEPIDRIVGSGACCDALAVEHPNRLRRLDEVTTDDFWDKVDPAWAPAASAATQVESMRKLWAHNDFVWLVTPHVEGKQSDETPFVTEFLSRVFGRSAAFPTPLVEIHTEGPEKVYRGSTGYPLALANLKANIAHSLSQKIPSGRSVKLFIWEKLLERVLIVGQLTPTSGGLAPAPRMCVHMGHIARMTDKTATEKHDWHLLSDARLNDMFCKYSNHLSPALVDASDVHGTAKFAGIQSNRRR